MSGAIAHGVLTIEFDLRTPDVNATLAEVGKALSASGLIPAGMDPDRDEFQYRLYADPVRVQRPRPNRVLPPQGVEITSLQIQLSTPPEEHHP